MKKNFLTMTAAIFVAVLAITGCAKDSADGNENGETTTVNLRLVGGAASRAVGPEISNNATVTFGSGYVIFTNAVNSIIKVTEIVPGSYPSSPSEAEQQAKENGSKVWLADLQATDGTAINNVPEAAKAVYIVGNLPSTVSSPAQGMNISEVQSKMVTIHHQADNNGGVANVTLYGDEALLINHTTLENTRVATVNVNAIGARIEVGSISYSNPSDFVTAFQVDGIFLNNYYGEMSLVSKVSSAPVNNVPQNASGADDMYDPESGTSPYDSADEGILYDFDAAGIGHSVSSISWNADDGAGVWAYNVLAPLAFESPVTELDAPHIVVRLSGVETVDDQPGSPVYSTTQYITVKDFRKNDNTPITSFAPGYVYYITNLEFNESHISEVPEAEPVTVFVEAVLMQWKREELQWGN